MTRDSSLDEFLGGEPRDSQEERDADPDTDDVTDAESEAEPDSEPDGSVEPAVSTYEFSPDGAPCAACGAVVQKRWRDDGELVCPDCKAW